MDPNTTLNYLLRIWTTRPDKSLVKLIFDAIGEPGIPYPFGIEGKLENLSNEQLIKILAEKYTTTISGKN